MRLMLETAGRVLFGSEPGCLCCNARNGDWRSSARVLTDPLDWIWTV
jgi:hypothetical protein